MLRAALLTAAIVALALPLAAAETCVDCHGSHAALPPQVGRNKFEISLDQITTRLEDLAGMEWIAERLIMDILKRNPLAYGLRATGFTEVPVLAICRATCAAFPSVFRLRLISVKRPCTGLCLFVIDAHWGRVKVPSASRQNALRRFALFRERSSQLLFRLPYSGNSQLIPALALWGLEPSTLALTEAHVSMSLAHYRPATTRCTSPCWPGIAGTALVLPIYGGFPRSG